MKKIHKKSIFSVIFKVFTIICFISTMVLPPVYAQVLAGFYMPAPGTMVSLSDSFTPILLKGIKIFPSDPLRMDFIMDQGDEDLANAQLQQQYTKIIKYFLAALTVPDDDMWVNLSPNEPDRIIPSSFGETRMGCDLLAQDYLLKQLTASLLHPEKDVGRKFWDRVRIEAKERFGVTDIPVDTFNKVWIMPETAEIFENGDVAFVTQARLKVMLDQDYLSRKAASVEDTGKDDSSSQIARQVIREIIIPELEREVNEGKSFAILRQTYYALILAEWFKQNLRHNVLNTIYANRSATDGIQIEESGASEKIYRQYLDAFKQGVYSFIKEDVDETTGHIIPRKYFSGGVDYALLASETGSLLRKTGTSQQVEDGLDPSRSNTVPVRLIPQQKTDAAMLYKPPQGNQRHGTLTLDGEDDPEFFKEGGINEIFLRTLPDGSRHVIRVKKEILGFSFVREYQETFNKVMSYAHALGITPKLFRSGALNGNMFFAEMEYIEGDSVEDYISKHVDGKQRVEAAVKELLEKLFQGRLYAADALKKENLVLQDLSDGSVRAYLIDVDMLENFDGEAKRLAALYKEDLEIFGSRAVDDENGTIHLLLQQVIDGEYKPNPDLLDEDSSDYTDAAMLARGTRIRLSDEYEGILTQDTDIPLKPGDVVTLLFDGESDTHQLQVTSTTGDILEIRRNGSWFRFAENEKLFQKSDEGIKSDAPKTLRREKLLEGVTVFNNSVFLSESMRRPLGFLSGVKRKDLVFHGTSKLELGAILLEDGRLRSEKEWKQRNGQALTGEELDYLSWSIGGADGTYFSEAGVVLPLAAVDISEVSTGEGKFEIIATEKSVPVSSGLIFIESKEGNAFLSEIKKSVSDEKMREEILSRVVFFDPKRYSPNELADILLDEGREYVLENLFFRGFEERFAEAQAVKKRMKENFDIAERLDATVHGEPLEDHVERVFEQFERQFPFRWLPQAIDRTFFRTFFVLHDIGKPDAPGDDQYEETSRVIELVRQDSGLRDLLGENPDFKIDLMKALASDDPIGKAIKGDISVEEAVDRINEMYASIDIPSGVEFSFDDFVETLYIYYQSDASSYTTLAGDWGATDGVFLHRFGEGFAVDPATGLMKFAGHAAEVFQELEDGLADPSMLSYQPPEFGQGHGKAFWDRQELEFLGQGGISDVFLRTFPDGTQHVIKIERQAFRYHQINGGDPAEYLEFYREIHKQAYVLGIIPELFDSGFLEGRLFYTEMERIEGVNIGESIFKDEAVKDREDTAVRELLKRLLKGKFSVSDLFKPGNLVLKELPDGSLRAYLVDTDFLAYFDGSVQKLASQYKGGLTLHGWLYGAGSRQKTESFLQKVIEGEYDPASDFMIEETLRESADVSMLSYQPPEVGQGHGKAFWDVQELEFLGYGENNDVFLRILPDGTRRVIRVASRNPFSSAMDEEVVWRYLEDFNMMHQRLYQQGIVPELFDSGVLEGKIFYSEMEYVEGVDVWEYSNAIEIDDFSKRAKFEATVRDFLEALLEEKIYISDALKPANLILRISETGDLKLYLIDADLAGDFKGTTEELAKRYQRQFRLWNWGEGIQKDGEVEQFLESVIQGDHTVLSRVPVQVAAVSADVSMLSAKLRGGAIIRYPSIDSVSREFGEEIDIPIEKVFATDTPSVFELQDDKGKKRLVSQTAWPVSTTGLEVIDRRLGHHEKIIQLARLNPSRRITVLDLGCGDGTALVELYQDLQRRGIRNVDVVGLSKEFYPKWNQAPEGVEFILAETRDLEAVLGSESIDFIYSHIAVNHMFRSDGESFAQQLGAVLKPGGELRTSPFEDADYLENLVSQEEISGYVPGPQQNMLKEAGLERFYEEGRDENVVNVGLFRKTDSDKAEELSGTDVSMLTMKDWIMDAIQDQVDPQLHSVFDIGRDLEMPEGEVGVHVKDKEAFKTFKYHFNMALAELLQNALKHADAEPIRVEASVIDGDLKVTIINRGEIPYEALKEKALSIAALEAPLGVYRANGVIFVHEGTTKDFKSRGKVERMTKESLEEYLSGEGWRERVRLIQLLSLGHHEGSGQGGFGFNIAEGLIDNLGGRVEENFEADIRGSDHGRTAVTIILPSNNTVEFRENEMISVSADNSDTVGGIDFTSDELNLRKQGPGMNVTPEWMLEDLQNMSVSGFTPVILDIQPLSNLPLLLGKEGSSQPIDNPQKMPQGSEQIEGPLAFLINKNTDCVSLKS